MRISNLNKRLVLLLDNKHLTQKELSLMTGLTESAISHYVKGDRVPNTTSLIAIAEVTKVSPNWLLGYGPDDPMEMM